MRRLGGWGKEIELDLEGKLVPALDGEPVAASLLAAGESVFARSVKYHRPRGPFCFSGGCSQCLMRVDGVPNLHTCRVPARAGLKLERQNAYPSAKFDLLAATDWLFPKGLDHHEMFAHVPAADRVLTRVARHLAGLGKLPDEAPPSAKPAETIRTKVAVVGAGPAGSSAARALEERGLPYLLIEREPYLGGRLVHGAPDSGEPPPLDPAPTSVCLEATAVGLYDDEEGRFLAVLRHWSLLKVYAERFLLAPGGTPTLIAFENNDIPGVLAGRAVSRLLRVHRLLPGERFALIGEGAEMYALARLLESNGATVAAVVDLCAAPGKGALFVQPVRALGRRRLHGLEVRGHDGALHRIDCDAVALCRPPAPSFELARQGGALVVFDEQARTFAVKTDAHGRTTQRGLFVAGEVASPMSALAAAEHGRRAAQAIASELSGGL
ncbi:MAG: (2Fe-2S)-binding protein [Myxococcales bacterium]|nr:(2Fe-2S)-binding protein [Myxococcales bacterium]